MSDVFKWKTSFAGDIDYCEDQHKVRCSKCGETKFTVEFSLTGKEPKKPLARCRWQSYCKKCLSKAQQDWRLKNRDIVNKRAKERAKAPHRRLKTLIGGNTKLDRTQLSFDVLWKRLEDNNFRCEITNQKFVFDASRNPNALSIDKINPNKPYTDDNVRLVCWWVNVAMSNWGLEELKRLIKDWQVNGRF